MFGIVKFALQLKFFFVQVGISLLGSFFAKNESIFRFFLQF